MKHKIQEYQDGNGKKLYKVYWRTSSFGGWHPYSKWIVPPPYGLTVPIIFKSLRAADLFLQKQVREEKAEIHSLVKTYFR